MKWVKESQVNEEIKFQQHRLHYFVIQIRIAEIMQFQTLFKTPYLSKCDTNTSCCGGASPWVSEAHYLPATHILLPLTLARGWLKAISTLLAPRAPTAARQDRASRERHGEEMKCWSPGDSEIFLSICVSCFLLHFQQNNLAVTRSMLDEDWPSGPHRESQSCTWSWASSPAWAEPKLQTSHAGGDGACVTVSQHKEINAEGLKIGNRWITTSLPRSGYLQCSCGHRGYSTSASWAIAKQTEEEECNWEENHYLFPFPPMLLHFFLRRET